MPAKLLATKAITYRLLSMLITFSVVYTFTRSLPLTTGATAAIEILKTVWYYIYDSIWDRLGFITVKAKEVGGIKEGYPLVPLPEKAKGFIALMRPMTMTGGILAGFFLVILASSYYNIPLSLSLALLTGICLAILHAASQALNQAAKEEIEIDKINKPYRPVVKGIITPEEAMLFSVILFLIAAVLAFAIKPIFIIGISTIAFFSIFYTLPPLRMKRRFVLNNIWQGIARGFLPPVAVFSIFSPHLDILPVALGIIIALWIMGLQSAKDVDDIEGDKEFGIRNFFTVWGEEKALNVMGILMVFSFVVLNVFVYLEYLPVSMVPLNILAVPSFGIIHFLNKSSQLTENNVGWILFYGTVGLWYIFPAVLYSVF